MYGGSTHHNGFKPTNHRSHAHSLTVESRLPSNQTRGKRETEPTQRLNDPTHDVRQCEAQGRDVSTARGKLFYEKRISETWTVFSR